MTRFEFILFWNTYVIIAIKVAYMFFLFFLPLKKILWFI